jgi:hypothetical protein
MEEVLRTPAGTSALIKIYFALYLPNLFSCQSSSSEKRRSLFVVGSSLTTPTHFVSPDPPERVWIFLTAKSEQLIAIFQPNVRRQNDFL